MKSETQTKESTELTLFPRDNRFEHETRAALKSEGYDPEEVDKLTARELNYAFGAVLNQQAAETRIHEAIARGYLRESDIKGRSLSEQDELWLQAIRLENFRQSKKRSRDLANLPPQDDSANEYIARSEVVAVLHEAVTLMAAMKNEIDHLKTELAESRNAQIAAFGRHALVDQLTKAERDIEGFEVTLELETEARTKTETEHAQSTEKLSSVADGRDTRAALQGLANHVVGLDVDRKVDTSKLERALKELSERSASDVKTKTRGHVHMKFGKVTGGKKPE